MAVEEVDDKNNLSSHKSSLFMKAESTSALGVADLPSTLRGGPTARDSQGQIVTHIDSNGNLGVTGIQAHHS